MSFPAKKLPFFWIKNGVPHFKKAACFFLVFMYCWFYNTSKNLETDS